MCYLVPNISKTLSKCLETSKLKSVEVPWKKWAEVMKKWKWKMCSRDNNKQT
jgi:hypothetical protein